MPPPEPSFPQDSRMSSRHFWSLLAVTFGLAGCSDSTSPEAFRVSLSLAASGPAASVNRIVTAQDITLNDGTSELVLTRVALVLREIELERVSAEDCLDDDDCEEFETGPVLLELPLDGTVTTAVTVDVPADTYDELEFEIHKPESSDDAAFIAANPDFSGVSIRVEGTFDGNAFVYTTDLDAEQEIELDPPLMVGETESVNLTLRLDVTTWFENGGTLVDPATANDGGANEGLVENNIEQSIDVFEDDDRDGDDDAS